MVSLLLYSFFPFILLSNSLTRYPHSQRIFVLHCGFVPSASSPTVPSPHHRLSRWAIRHLPDITFVEFLIIENKHITVNRALRLEHCQVGRLLTRHKISYITQVWLLSAACLEPAQGHPQLLVIPQKCCRYVRDYLRTYSYARDLGEHLWFTFGFQPFSSVCRVSSLEKCKETLPNPGQHRFYCESSTGYGQLTRPTSPTSPSYFNMCNTWWSTVILPIIPCKRSYPPSQRPGDRPEEHPKEKLSWTPCYPFCKIYLDFRGWVWACRMYSALIYSSDPFLNLTHWEILFPSASEYWWKWNVLTQFAKLTHLHRRYHPGPRCLETPSFPRLFKTLDLGAFEFWPI